MCHGQIKCLYLCFVYFVCMRVCFCMYLYMYLCVCVSVCVFLCIVSQCAAGRRTCGGDDELSAKERERKKNQSLKSKSHRFLTNCSCHALSHQSVLVAKQCENHKQTVVFVFCHQETFAISESYLY